MDINNFPLHFEYAMHSGNSISREEQTILTWSLRELHRLNKFKETYFWGILYGNKNDYYIAYGVRSGYIKGRIYYYSVDCEEWVLLPKPIERLEKKVLIAHTLLTGDPSFQLEVNDDQPFEEKGPVDEEPTHDVNEATEIILEDKESIQVNQENNQSEEKNIADEKNINENNIKEEDRLSLLVKLITEECAIVPRGAYVKEMSGRVVKDDRFKGLDPDEAVEFRSYFHLRVPRLKYNDNLTHRTDSDIAIDIFDTIDDDVPSRKTWTIRNTDDNMVIIKNLTWPGMMFYHKVKTDIFGFVYFGFGHRNLDLPFML